MCCVPESQILFRCCLQPTSHKLTFSDDGWSGWVNQAYSRLSTTHGHITDCKLDSVVYEGVCVVI